MLTIILIICGWTLATLVPRTDRRRWWHRRAARTSSGRVFASGQAFPEFREVSLLKRQEGGRMVRIHSQQSTGNQANWGEGLVGWLVRPTMKRQLP